MVHNIDPGLHSGQSNARSHARSRQGNNTSSSDVFLSYVCQVEAFLRIQWLRHLMSFFFVYCRLSSDDNIEESRLAPVDFIPSRGHKRPR